MPRAAVCREFGAAALGRGGDARSAAARTRCACASRPAPICHSDVAYADGAWGGELPAVFGHEACGVVAETGPGVERLAAGDRRRCVSLIRSCGACARCREGAPALCEARFRLDDDSPDPARRRRPGRPGDALRRLRRRGRRARVAGRADPGRPPGHERVPDRLRRDDRHGRGRARRGRRARSGRGRDRRRRRRPERRAGGRAGRRRAGDRGRRRRRRSSRPARALGATGTVDATAADPVAAIQAATGGAAPTRDRRPSAPPARSTRASPACAAAARWSCVGMPPNGEPRPLRRRRARARRQAHRRQQAGLVAARRRTSPASPASTPRAGSSSTSWSPRPTRSSEINEAVAAMRRGEAIRNVIVL